MTEDARGSLDGRFVATFRAGEEHDLSDDLARVFVEQLGVAVRVDSVDAKQREGEGEVAPAAEAESPAEGSVGVAAPSADEVARKPRRRKVPRS